MRTFRLGFRTTRVPKVGGASKLGGCLAVLAKLGRSGWTPDVIHAHEYQAGRTALLLGRLVRAPVVVSEHYSGFALGTLPPRERQRAGGCSSVPRLSARRVATSCRGSSRSHPQHDSSPSRTRSTPISSGLRTGEQPCGATRPLRLVTVGSLVEIKGHRYLLEALARSVPDRDLELDLVGAGLLRDQLSALARSLELEGRVRFHGSKTHRGVAAVLREAHVFVLPSLWENMPCALLEAMACGLPSVATRVGDVSEPVDEDAGVVVSPGSAEELAAGIAAVESRLDRYDRFGLAARTAATFGNAAICDRWTAVYTAALTRSPSTA